MKESAKIAISLPPSLLERVEDERRVTGESRSEFIRRAVAALLRVEEERRADEQYVEAYRKYPETPEEVEGFFRSGMDVWLDNPWEEETGDLREAG